MRTPRGETKVMSDTRRRSKWSRDELTVVLALYFRLPQAKFTDSEPEVIETARLIGRTPASVAIRLANYLALDERSGAAGLSHGGDHARKVWEEFAGNAALVASEAAAARERILKSDTPSQE